MVQPTAIAASQASSATAGSEGGRRWIAVHPALEVIMTTLSLRVFTPASFESTSPAVFARTPASIGAVIRAKAGYVGVDPRGKNDDEKVLMRSVRVAVDDARANSRHQRGSGLPDGFAYR